MKKVVIILVIGLSTSSCSFSQKTSESTKDVYTVINELLKRDNYVIPDSLFSFFPDKSNKYTNLEILKISENAERTEIPFGAEEFRGYEIIELYQCKNKVSLQQLVKKYRSQSIFSIKSESTDYFVLDSERELFKDYDMLQLKKKYVEVRDKIIVSFKEFADDTSFSDTTTISGLSSGFEILVLKSGSNFILPQDRLYEWSVLPDNLKHGYRSGVAFKEDEPYIIYWVVAW